MRSRPGLTLHLKVVYGNGLLQEERPSGKLLIPLERRDVRVVEGARLESVCTGNRTEGSNPSLSAILLFRSRGRAGRMAYGKQDKDFRSNVQFDSTKSSR